MALMENVQEIVLTLKSGKTMKLKPCSVTRVLSRVEGESMAKHGSVVYYHIIASDPEGKDDG